MKVNVENNFMYEFILLHTVQGHRHVLNHEIMNQSFSNEVYLLYPAIDRVNLALEDTPRGTGVSITVLGSKVTMGLSSSPVKVR